MWKDRSKTQVYHPSFPWTFILVSQSYPSTGWVRAISASAQQIRKASQSQGKISLVGFAVLPRLLVTHLPSSRDFQNKNLHYEVNVFYISFGVAFLIYREQEEKTSTSTVKKQQCKKYNIACIELEWRSVFNLSSCKCFLACQPCSCVCRTWELLQGGSFVWHPRGQS